VRFFFLNKTKIKDKNNKKDKFFILYYNAIEYLNLSAKYFYANK